MAAPTFVGSAQSVWNNVNTPKSVNLSVTVGDVVVVAGVTEDSGITLNTPTATGYTFTLQGSVLVASRTAAYVWTAIAPSTGTATISIARGATSNFWGMVAANWTSTGGVGNANTANAASAAPSVSLTTSANSAVFAINGDWNALTTSRTWRTVNAITPTAGNGLELVYDTGGTHYTIYGAYWNDTGAAGSNTYGLTLPNTQNYSLIAVEVLGTAAAAPAFPPSQVHRGRTAVPVRPRRRTSGPVPAQVVVAPPAYAVPPVHRLRAVLGRIRGRSASPVPAQVVVAPPAYPVPPVHRLRQVLGRIRGRSVAPVPPQVVVPPPPYVPPAVHRLRQVLGRVRGRFATPVPPQQTPPVGVWVPLAHTPKRVAAQARRPRMATPPQVQALAPQPSSHPRRILFQAKRRKATPVPPQVVIIPPPYPPQPVYKRLLAFVTRRGRVESAPLIGAAPNLCVTPRPSTGTTGRPGSGVTAYNTATTGRPGTGTTTRPNTGSTPDPC